MVKAPELTSPGPFAFGRDAVTPSACAGGRRTMVVRRGWGAGRGKRPALCVLALVAGASGCFLRDPLDPHGELGHHVVQDLSDAEQRAKGREAFERARGRVGNVQSGMSISEVETVMQAIVLAQGHGDEPD